MNNSLEQMSDEHVKGSFTIKVYIELRLTRLRQVRPIRLSISLKTKIKDQDYLEVLVFILV